MKNRDVLPFLSPLLDGEVPAIKDARHEQQLNVCILQAIGVYVHVNNAKLSLLLCARASSSPAARLLEIDFSPK